MPESDPSFRNALRVREFRLLWLAGAQSSAGDQLSRIAIMLLVYARSGSAAVSGLTYALTFLPALFGGMFLSGLADRYPRRTVMVTCDLIRLVLLVVLALASVSILVIDVLLVLIVLVGAPFSSASAAIGPQVLPPENYVAGVSLAVITGQLAQLIAFAAGGVCVSFLGVRTTLLLDAVTFGVSACLIRYGMADRPAPIAAAAVERPSYLTTMLGGVRVVFGEPLLRCLVLFAWLSVFFIAPEAIAPAYAHSLGGGATATGLLMAAMPAGAAVGAWRYARWGTDAFRVRAMPYLAGAASVTLIASWLSPNLVVALGLWFLCGLFGTYQISVMTRFIQRVPDQVRGQAVGLGATGLVAIQGLGALIAGALASWWSPAAAVGLAGVAGVLSVALLLGPLRRAEGGVEPARTLAPEPS